MSNGHANRTTGTERVPHTRPALAALAWGLLAAALASIPVSVLTDWWTATNEFGLPPTWLVNAPFAIVGIAALAALAGLAWTTVGRGRTDDAAHRRRGRSVLALLAAWVVTAVVGTLVLAVAPLAPHTWPTMTFRAALDVAALVGAVAVATRPPWT